MTPRVPRQPVPTWRSFRQRGEELLRDDDADTAPADAVRAAAARLHQRQLEAGQALARAFLPAEVTGALHPRARCGRAGAAPVPCFSDISPDSRGAGQSRRHGELLPSVGKRLVSTRFVRGGVGLVLAITPDQRRAGRIRITAAKIDPCEESRNGGSFGVLFLGKSGRITGITGWRSTLAPRSGSGTMSRFETEQRALHPAVDEGGLGEGRIEGTAAGPVSASMFL